MSARVMRLIRWGRLIRRVVLGFVMRVLLRRLFVS